MSESKWNKFVASDSSTWPTDPNKQYLICTRELGVEDIDGASMIYIGETNAVATKDIEYCEWWDDTGEYRLDGDGYEVVAWMELPEPYREER